MMDENFDIVKKFEHILNKMSSEEYESILASFMEDLESLKEKSNAE